MAVFCCATFITKSCPLDHWAKHKTFLKDVNAIITLQVVSISIYLWCLTLEVSRFNAHSQYKYRSMFKYGTSEWAIMWRRNYFLRENCPTYYVSFLPSNIRLSRKQRDKTNVAT